MIQQHFIEVAVRHGTSTTARGRVLERFSKRFLGTQNYSVEEEVRLTASEVDLLATDKTTGETIFVECKAHRSPISAEVLQKLLGNVTFREYDAGWLICTFALGKDAKGFETEWQKKKTEERRKLRIYPPEKLIERLVAARVIIDTSQLKYDRSRFKVGNEGYLLLTETGEYWEIPVVESETGIPSSSMLFDAGSGERVTDKAALDAVSATDKTLNLPWISDDPHVQDEAESKLKTDLESIVSVPVAEHWADYRPARPVDFVGRETVQSSVFGFLDKVREGGTQTRLIALKGPSGWGKSSTILKIASRAANTRNRGKYFIFTVDSRAATTRRFPELAIVTAVREAVKKGFVNVESPLEFGGASSLLSSPGMEEFSRKLNEQGKVLCVFFDQFEELLYKSELAGVFEEMRRISASVEEAQSNVVVGFSWKTDGVIPTEHGAYHMWHSLADRRFEIELTPFTEREVSLAINRFAKELRQPVVPQLRRVLQDHCQGFPWLLKKLCVHIVELSRSGIDQMDILGRSMNIQELFRRDLENLSAIETGCIKQIAAESPAEFFKIAQNFGDDTVSRLTDKRLVIRRATRLTIYWDIFRDYILTEKIPYIPVTYVPQANFSRFAEALLYLVGKGRVSYGDLASQMSLGSGAADNLVRDLVNVGHVEADRKESYIVPTFDDEKQAITIAFKFWRSHEVIRRLLELKVDEREFSEKEFIEGFRVANKRSAVGEKTLQIYAMRMLRWLIGIGLVKTSSGSLVLNESLSEAIPSLHGVGVKRLTPGLFLGEAPPRKVVKACEALFEGGGSRAHLEEQHGRNTCYALCNLGIMEADGAIAVSGQGGTCEELVAVQARGTPTVRFVAELLGADGDRTGKEVGAEVSRHFSLGWSDGSQRRNGGALRGWARWAEGLHGD